MASTACRIGDRSSQRVTALEEELERYRAALGMWQTFQPGLWTLGFRSAQPTAAEPTEPAQPRALMPVNLGIGGTRTGWYLRIGNRLHVRYAFTWGQRPWDAGPGRVVTEMPPGMLGEASVAQYVHCHLWTTSGTEGTMDFWGSAMVYPKSRDLVQPMFPFSAVDCRLGFYTIAGPTAGQRTWSVPYIATGFPEGGILAIQGTLDVS